MRIQHKAFLDLEAGLTTRVRRGWKQLYAPLRAELHDAIKRKDWVEADRLIDTLNTDRLVQSYAHYAQTVGLSALLLGASRLVGVHDSVIAHSPPTRQLGNAVTQWGYQIARNAPRMLRRTLHVQLAALEHRVEQARHVVTKDAAPALYDFEYDAAELVNQIELDGAQFMSLTSSLMVSRLSSFGFLVQAQEQGIVSYEISEILDDSTCPVCEVMDGQIFSVAAGISQASSIMDAEDPDSLALVAPWPGQSKAAVADLAESNTADLVEAGLALPPYHPGCRGIVVPSTDTTASDQAAAASAAASDLDVPALSLGTLAALLGMAGGELTPARTHQGQALQGELDAADEEEEEEEDEDAADEQPARGKKKKKPQESGS